MKKFGIIGGSGLYEISGLTDVRSIAADTPFGSPSDEIVHGYLGDTELFFLPRHGRGHRWSPSEINYRANIFALKQLGVEWILAVAAVGSLRLEIKPGDLVIPDQFIDRTVARPSTFFTNGIVAHVSMADPVCGVLGEHVERAARKSGAAVHVGGTYLCMEGPQFSTRAESEMYRSWNADIIGMTNLQEAKLAREAEICFATLALASDYDCWNREHRDVTIEDILRVIHSNVQLARHCIEAVAGDLSSTRSCPCASALKNAIVTDPKVIPPALKASLQPIVGRYLT